MPARRKQTPDRLAIHAEVEAGTDQDQVIDGLVELYRALNAYHIACGGSGLVIDDWKVFVTDAVLVGDV